MIFGHICTYNLTTNNVMTDIITSFQRKLNYLQIDV